MRWTPGDKALPASQLNRFADAADRILGQAPAPHLKTSQVLIQNSTGADLDRHQIAGLGSPVFSPATYEDSFKEAFLIDAAAVTQADHWGKFAVTLEPISAGEVGRAAVSDIVHVQIDMKHASHAYADVNDGDKTKLRSSGFGSARILSVDSGTGTKWAIVQLQARGSYEGEIEITGNSQVTLGEYRYAWSEVYVGSGDGRETVTGGLSGTTSSGYASNLAEINQTASGIIGGVDTDGTDYPSSYNPKPIGGGGTDETHQLNAVVSAVFHAGKMWFDRPMAHDGDCT